MPFNTLIYVASSITRPLKSNKYYFSRVQISNFGPWIIPGESIIENSAENPWSLIEVPKVGSIEIYNKQERNKKSISRFWQKGIKENKKNCKIYSLLLLFLRPHMHKSSFSPRASNGTYAL